MCQPDHPEVVAAGEHGSIQDGINHNQADIYGDNQRWPRCEMRQPKQERGHAYCRRNADEGRESALNQRAVGQLLADERKSQHGKQHTPADAALEWQPRLDMRQVFGEVGFGPQRGDGLHDQAHQHKQNPIGAQVSPKGARLEAQITPGAAAQAAFDEHVNHREEREQRLGSGQKPYT